MDGHLLLSHPCAMMLLAGVGCCMVIDSCEQASVCLICIMMVEGFESSWMHLLFGDTVVFKYRLSKGSLSQMFTGLSVDEKRNC